MCYSILLIDQKEIEDQQFSLENITMSSAYIRRFCDNISKGTHPEFNNSFSKSLAYELKTMGDNSSPCIKPR